MKQKRLPANTADHSMTARQILDLLLVRHAKDVAVPECKDGPTQVGSHRRLDLWAMAKSWAHPCLDGYEIKVSRSDFRRDDKMHSYLPLCNRLWVACPRKLIEPGELPPEVGLIYATPGGARLQMAKRAPFRTIAPPVDLLNYVLMSRAAIVREYAPQEKPERGDRAEFWRKWLESEGNLHGLGYMVSKKLRIRINDELEKAERRAEVAERQAKSIADAHAEAERLFTELGITPGANTWRFRDRLRDALAGTGVLRAIGESERALSELRRILEPPPVEIEGEEAA